MTAPLGKLVVGDHPAELDPLVGAVQALQRRLRLARVDLVAEAAARAEGQAEEFQLVGARLGALGQQLEAALAHLRVLLVGQQLDAVVERSDRRQQVVAQARAKQAGEVDGVHARVMRESLT